MAKQALLLSIRQQFAKQIFAGRKQVELRRMRPKLTPGDLIFIYVPSPAKAVQGAFEVKEIVSAPPATLWQRFGTVAGLAKCEFDAYFKGKQLGCAIVIGEVWRLAQPVLLEELRKQARKFRAPQSYHYKCPNAFSRSVGFRLPRRLAV